MLATAARLGRVQPSATKAVTQKARQYRLAGRDILTLSQGEPDFDTPTHIQVFAKRAIDAGETRYTEVAGKFSLREAIAEDILSSDAVRISPENITVGCGAKQVLFNALMAILSDGDEVIVPTPSWVSYPSMVELAGGRPVMVGATLENGYKLTPAALLSALSPKTSCLILNSPNNPTGSVYTGAELAELASVLAKHPSVLVISDEIYRNIFYSGDRAPSFFAQHEILRDQLLVVNGVSKAYAMTGWRVGWGAGPTELIQSMNTIQSQSSSHTCSIAQAAAEGAYRGTQQPMRDMKSEFKRRRDVVVREIRKVDGLAMRVPDGAFYAFVSCKNLLGTKTLAGKHIDTDIDLADYLLEEQGVAVVPGSAFGAGGYVRISYASNEETLLDGCRRIADGCDALVRTTGTTA